MNGLTPRLRSARSACALGAVVVTAVLGAGCGDDEDEPLVAGAETAPFLSLSEVRGEIDATDRLAVVRTGDSDPRLPEGAPALVDSVRLESQSGREFDLLVFRSEREAQRAVPTVVDLDGGESGARAANVVAVFPERFSRVPAYAPAARAIRRLRVACTPGGAGEPRLRELCFDPVAGADIPPEGEGVDRDGAQEEEKPIEVAGLRYDPLVARQLNPRIEPGEALVSGRSPPDGKTFFAVFLRVCNYGDRPRRAADQLALIDAFGKRIEPVELPAGNPFAYDSVEVEPGKCLPAPGSVTERSVDGYLVLFAVTTELLRDRPVALEVAADGVRERVILDL